MAQRTLPEKVADTKSTYQQFAELLTPPETRGILGNMTGAMQQAAAETGDVQAYSSLVQAALSLQRLVSANDRVALLAATMLQSGSPARLIPLDGGEAGGE